MEFILKLKHWQVFLILILGMILSNSRIENNLTLTITLKVIGIFLSFGWTLMVGHELYYLLPKKIEFNYTLFVINWFIWMAAFITVTVLSNGEGMTFHGLAALPGFYVFYALLNISMFPAKVLRSIEQNRRVEGGESIGDFLFVLFLPVGIWNLQPRVNKLAERAEADE